MPIRRESDAADLPSLLAVCTLPPLPVLDGYSLRVSHLLRHLAPRWSIILIAPPSGPIAANTSNT